MNDPTQPASPVGAHGHLFDPEPYGGAPKPKLQKPQWYPDDVRLVDDDPRWRVFTSTRRGVDGYAHIATSVSALVIPLCTLDGTKHWGEMGRPLTLDGARVAACPACWERRAGPAWSA
jgi:hypothetical protein